MTTIGADTILAAFRRLGEGPADESTTLGALVTSLDARAHALVLLLLAAPNLTPGPSMPGFSTIFAVPLCIVAFEMMLGRRRLRLPAFLARIEIRRGRIAGFVGRLEPLLHRLERVLKPRGPALAGPDAERPLGFVCVLLGVLLALPIPLFSMLPACAVLAIALGLLTRDGLAVAVGLGTGVVAIIALAVLVTLAVAALTAG
jgi:hypothetical protein